MRFKLKADSDGCSTVGMVSSRGAPEQLLSKSFWIKCCYAQNSKAQIDFVQCTFIRRFQSEAKKARRGRATNKPAGWWWEVAVQHALTSEGVHGKPMSRKRLHLAEAWLRDQEGVEWGLLPSCDRGETALSAPARGRLLCSSSGSDAGSGSDLDVATSGVDPITTDDDFVIELLAQEQQTEAESAAEVEVDAGGANALACVSVSDGDGDGDGDLDLISF